MEEIKFQYAGAEVEDVTDEKIREFEKILTMFVKLYLAKDPILTDKQWLEYTLKQELPEATAEEIDARSSEIINSIEIFDDNLNSVNEAAANGVSKEDWLANKLQEVSSSMSVNEYGKTLQNIDNFLRQKNQEMHEALSRSSDGHIKMSPNLDGNIAENMFANTTELSGFLQDKNIKVEVRDVFTSNSVDVRATNLETGKYQNYQIKFGQNAEETINLIKRGDYTNQRLVVPTEQVEEVQKAFPTKTVTDHIDAWGAKSKTFTKENVKELQKLAQEDGIMPSMDYNHYQLKDLAMSIGKNTVTMSLQSAAVSTGLNIVSRAMQNEKIEADEMVEIAVKTGVDTGVKVAVGGALQVAVRRELIPILVKTTPAGIIANIACVGIENAKVLYKIASGEFSITQGLDQMGRVTTSMIGGLTAIGKGAAIGASLTAWIPVAGVPLSIVTGFVGGMVGYVAGSKIGEAVFEAGKTVCETAKSIASNVLDKMKDVGRSIIEKPYSLVASLFSW